MRSITVTFRLSTCEELKNKPDSIQSKSERDPEKRACEATMSSQAKESDFDTMEEYKKSSPRSYMLEDRRAKTADEDKGCCKSIEDSNNGKSRNQMVEEQLTGWSHDYARRLESQGISFKQYVENTGMTAEKIGEQMRPAGDQENPDKTCLEAVVKG